MDALTARDEALINQNWQLLKDRKNDIVRIGLYGPIDPRDAVLMAACTAWVGSLILGDEREAENLNKTFDMEL